MSSTQFTEYTSTEAVEKWTLVAGDSVPYLVAGDSAAPNLLLVHGAGASRKDWREIVPILADKSMVYAPDLIGFGDTPRRSIPHTPQYIARFLVEFMDSIGLEDATLIGHSLGGRVCLEVARMYPDRVNGLALEAPMGFGKLRWQGRALSIARLWLYRVMGLKSPYPPLDFPRIEEGSSAFESLECDTMLLWGGRDLYFPPEHGFLALECIPNSSIKVYPKIGHSLHRSIPAQFSSDVAAFLAELA